MPAELEPKTAAERDEGRILLDVESVRKWADIRRLHVVSEALPSGEFMQLSVLHPRLYEVVHRMFSAGADKSERAADQADRAAAAVIADDLERFKGFHPLQLENDPRYVVATEAAREYVSDIKAAIRAGELMAHDATGRPIAPSAIEAVAGAEAPELASPHQDEQTEPPASSARPATEETPVECTCAMSDAEQVPLATVETPAERSGRLKARAGKLQASGVRAWQRQLAAEEGISQSRVKQILKSDEKRRAAPDPASIFGQINPIQKPR